MANEGKIEHLRHVWNQTPDDTFTVIAEILEDHERRLQEIEARFPAIAKASWDVPQ